MHPGTGPGLTARRLGQRGGVEAVTLSEAQMPGHNHAMMASPNPGEAPGPGSGNALARPVGGAAYGPADNLVSLAKETMPNAGGGQAHDNMQPFLAVNFIIALQGLYPQRS
jgi:microcystin-dependent protein